MKETIVSLVSQQPTKQMDSWVSIKMETLLIIEERGHTGLLLCFIAAHGREINTSSTDIGRFSVVELLRPLGCWPCWHLCKRNVSQMILPIQLPLAIVIGFLWSQQLARIFFLAVQTFHVDMFEG